MMPYVTIERHETSYYQHDGTKEEAKSETLRLLEHLLHRRRELHRQLLAQRITYAQRIEKSP